MGYRATVKTYVEVPVPHPLWCDQEFDSKVTMAIIEFQQRMLNEFGLRTNSHTLDDFEQCEIAENITRKLDSHGVSEDERRELFKMFDSMYRFPDELRIEVEAV